VYKFILTVAMFAIALVILVCGVAKSFMIPSMIVMGGIIAITHILTQ